MKYDLKTQYSPAKLQKSLSLKTFTPVSNTKKFNFDAELENESFLIIYDLIFPSIIFLAKLIKNYFVPNYTVFQKLHLMNIL